MQLLISLSLSQLHPCNLPSVPTSAPVPPGGCRVTAPPLRPSPGPTWHGLGAGHGAPATFPPDLGILVEEGGLEDADNLGEVGDHGGPAAPQHQAQELHQAEAQLLAGLRALRRAEALGQGRQEDGQRLAGPVAVAEPVAEELEGELPAPLRRVPRQAARQRPHQLRPENLLHHGARERPLLHLGPDGLQRPQPRRPAAVGLLQAAQGPAQGLRHLGRPGRRHAPPSLRKCGGVAKDARGFYDGARALYGEAEVCRAAAAPRAAGTGRAGGDVPGPTAKPRGGRAVAAAGTVATSRSGTGTRYSSQAGEKAGQT